MPNSLLALFSHSHGTMQLQFHWRQVFDSVRVETTSEESACIKSLFQTPMPLHHPSSLAISKKRAFICPDLYLIISLNCGDAQHSAADPHQNTKAVFINRPKHNQTSPWDLTSGSVPAAKAKQKAAVMLRLLCGGRFEHTLAGRYINLHLLVFLQPLGTAPILETLWTVPTSLQQAQILPFAWLKTLWPFLYAFRSTSCFVWKWSYPSKTNK